MDKIARIRSTLDGLYERYNRRELIPPDPLQFVYEYESAADREIAGFFSSLLAYGRVEQIGKSLRKLFSVMEGGPHEFVSTFDRTGVKALAGFKHRFTDGATLAEMCRLLKWVIAEFGSIEGLFLEHYSADDANILPALSGFREALLKRHRQETGRDAGRSMRYLLADPAGQSACKRMNLFLRWMVRDDDVDAGLWKGVSPAKLIVPMDVHMTRLCRFLGLYKGDSATLKSAVEVTAAFAQIEPDDPVKYDFALSRIGIVENCTGKKNERCKCCELLDFCLARGF